MGPDVEVWHRQLLVAASAAICSEGSGRQRCTGPRKWAAQGFIDVQQVVERADIWIRDKQFRVDDKVDMQWRPLAARLQLLNCPVMPWACLVYAIDPDIGVYKNPGAAVVAEKASGGHVSQRCYRRAGSP